MAGKPITGDGLSPNIAGMTKNELYDIMSQMKALIEQNKHQAKDILIQNPSLTKALFQAQIMLGMVQPPQMIPNVQQAATQQPQQSGQPPQQSNIHGASSFTGQTSLQDKSSVSPALPPMRKQLQSQPSIPISSPSVPPVNLQSQPLASHPIQTSQQPKGHMNPQVNPMSVTQSSQVPNIPPSPLNPISQPLPIHQTQMSSVSSQLQLPLQTSGIPHMPLQTPMPQPRPPASSFHPQYGQQMGPNMGYQHGGPPQHLSQPMYHSSNKPQSSMGPSFPQGQPPLPNQQPPQSLYQGGGSLLGAEYNNQAGSSMQVDRGSSWMSGQPDSSTMTQIPGPTPFNPGQMNLVNQPSRAAPTAAPLSADMEKALLQQVMSLTPEQINLLPPEQRNQVLQLQQILRQ